MAKDESVKLVKVDAELPVNINGVHYSGEVEVREEVATTIKEVIKAAKGE